MFQSHLTATISLKQYKQRLARSMLKFCWRSWRLYTPPSVRLAYLSLAIHILMSTQCSFNSTKWPATSFWWNSSSWKLFQLFSPLEWGSPKDILPSCGLSNGLVESLSTPLFFRPSPACEYAILWSKRILAYQFTGHNVLDTVERSCSNNLSVT